MAWLAVIVATVGLSGALLSGALTTEGDFVNQPESKRAAELIEDRLRGPERVEEFVVVRDAGRGADDPVIRTFVEAMVRDVSALGPGVVEDVRSHLDGSEGFVSADGDSTLVAITLAGDPLDAVDRVDELHAVTLERQAPDGVEVGIAGAATLHEDFTALSEEDLAKGEAFGLPIALVVLLVVFGAVVAALLPIALAVAAVLVAVGIVALIGTFFNFSFFVVNMVTMMGLAVGIDYSLFIVSRFREERARGSDRLGAIDATADTASRAVFFSGVTVVLALAGMLLVPTTIFRSLAAGAILVVFAATAASMTLLPALLALLGDRIERGRLPRRASASRAGRERQIWAKVARGVMRRPVISVVAATAVLVVAALPAFQIRTGFSGVSTMPEGTQSREGFTLLSQEFAGGLTQPAEIVIDAPIDDRSVQDGLDRLRSRLTDDDAFAIPAPLEINEERDLAVLSVSINADPSSRAANDAVQRLRDLHIPDAFGGPSEAEVYVGGSTAFNADFLSLNRDFMPVVFVFVLGLSFLLLTIVFRSLVVAAKALIMNVLSVGAAYGLVVFVNQQGHGAGVLGFRQVEVIEAWLPLFLFSVLFGLSMDYHVFLLSRIKEHYDETGDNREAVAFGVQSTARIITGAALIMVAVFAGFAAGDLASMQQMGFGLAVAVLLDATLVRVVLVPAAMELLGDRNWYLPRWLEWLPEVNIERRSAGSKQRDISIDDVAESVVLPALDAPGVEAEAADTPTPPNGRRSRRVPN